MPLSFAQQEWQRYTALMDPDYNPQQLSFAPFSSSQIEEMRIADPFWDDAYCIQLQNGQGTLYFSNERSALLGVYHLLREAGCAFLRPGPSGEIIPRRQLNHFSADVTLRAAYRHRCICIEGANRLDNVLDMIDYAPKAGYNAYYTQFMECYTFFERWYTHERNPYRPAGHFSDALAREMQQAAIHEIKKRGLIYHAVGHGWTCEPFGIPGRHWASDGTVATPEQTRHFAQINGVRALRNGIGLNTNLCYSNPDTRAAMVNAITEYAQSHPEIDVLHVWLADDCNNHCECEQCQTALPSDFYVQLLNEIDERLTDAKLPVRIAFLLYYDLMYPPIKQKLIREDRFILMFAPITRSFSQSYKGVVPKFSGKPYVRNQVYFGRDLSENLGYLDAWQQQFQGDSFDFDYHLCTAHYFDPGNLTISRVLYDDIHALRVLKLNGLINCQMQRVTLPHGFALFIGGQALCNPEIDFQQTLEAYFRASFGAGWKVALDFCKELSHLFPMESMMNEDMRCEEDVQKLCAVKQLSQDFTLPNTADLPTAQAHSWQNLLFLKQMLPLYCDYCAQLIQKNSEGIADTWKKLESFIWQHEGEVQGDFDCYYFLQALRPR